MADKRLSEERQLVEEVLSPAFTGAVWTRNCELFYPAVLQDFQLGAVLPVVLYIQRWGRKRGRGRLLKTFAAEGSREVSVREIAAVLSSTPSIVGFGSDETSQAILGDLLLCYCLQNKKRAPGREEKVQRILATHYFSSWVDLPSLVSGLRSVPETLVAILSNQCSGRWLEVGNRSSPFPLGGNPRENLLLSLFSEGVDISGSFDRNRTSDRFSEADVAVDQLLAVRIAERLGEPPAHAASTEGTGVQNRLPLAIKQANEFRADVTSFLTCFSRSIPRLVLLPLLESAFSLGLTCTFLASIQVLLEWERTGVVPPQDQHAPFPLFVDCSASTNASLRAASEDATEQVTMRLAHLPSLLMCVRLLDQKAVGDLKLRADTQLMSTRLEPWPKNWMDLLGSILQGKHPRSEFLFNVAGEWCVQLSEKLAQLSPDLSSYLLDEQVQANPFWRLSEVLCMMRGNKGFATEYASFMDSCANVVSPNALCNARRIRNLGSVGAKTTKVVRSFLFSDVLLDYLVHRHLVGDGGTLHRGGIAYKEFLAILRQRYGFYVDKAPPGTELSSELLTRNRDILERRLRDLGLLVGVNDAESMKCLKARFIPN